MTTLDHVAGSSTNGTPSTTLTWNHTVSDSASILIVFVMYEWFAANNIQSVTFNGVAVPFVSTPVPASQAFGPLNMECYAFALSNPPKGTFQVKVTLNYAMNMTAVSNNYLSVDGNVWQVLTDAEYGTYLTASGSEQFTPGSYTSGVNGMAVGMIAHDSGVHPSAPGGQTIIWNQDNKTASPNYSLAINNMPLPTSSVLYMGATGLGGSGYVFLGLLLGYAPPPVNYVPQFIFTSQQGGPILPIRITTGASQQELREPLHTNYLRKWIINVLANNRSAIDDLVGWVRCCRGKGFTFLWKDPSDWFVNGSIGGDGSFVAGDPTTSEIFAVGDGTTTVFQLTKGYTTSEGTYTRAIRRPMASPLIYADDTLVTAVSIDYSTGLATFSSPPTSGVVLSWSGAFYILARMDTDEPELTLRSANAVVISGLDIMEVYDLG